MDLLKAAAVDITLLVITARSLAASRADEPDPHRKSRKRWAGEVKRAVAAYQAALWRSDDARFDAAAIARCRVAAEREMPLALLDREQIKAALGHQADALAGYTSARNDLWRLAHVIVNLRGVRRLLAGGKTSHLVEPRRSAGRRLQRRLRRAMTDYTRALLREAGHAHSAVATARQAAGSRLDQRCFACAAELTRATVAQSSVEDGVVRPMRAIADDWIVDPAQASTLVHTGPRTPA
jgi:hypothetical protein